MIPSFLTSSPTIPHEESVDLVPKSTFFTVSGFLMCFKYNQLQDPSQTEKPENPIKSTASE